MTKQKRRTEDRNYVEVYGRINMPAELETRGKAQGRYRTSIIVRRPSGKSDEIDLLLPQRFLDRIPEDPSREVYVSGSLFSTRKQDGHGEVMVAARYLNADIQRDPSNANRITLQGIIAGEPKTFRSPDNIPMCRFTIVTRRYSLRGDYVSVVCQGDTAETIARELTVDDPIQIMGNMRGRTVRGKNGQGDIRVHEVFAYRIARPL